MYLSTSGFLAASKVFCDCGENSRVIGTSKGLHNSSVTKVISEGINLCLLHGSNLVKIDF
jgi:hypothetical protein